MAKKNWKNLLQDCPTCQWGGPLFRYVTKSALDGGTPPNYLFTSGKRNRVNPEGTQCLYLAEDSATAQIEFEKYYSDIPPSVLYRVDFQAAAIIDLSKSTALKYLGLSKDDLFNPFRLAPTPTPLEQLGEAISLQSDIVAIKFPSAASHDKKMTGNNIAIFKNSITDPDRLTVYDPDNPFPERWP